METVPQIIVIAGPTAVGKTQVATEVCRRVGGAIVGCDSRQVFRHLSIGTAKPDATELDGTAHHMLDVAGPGETYHAHRYAREATQTINQLLHNGVVPVLTVGTGLFYEALQFELISTPAIDPVCRNQATEAVSHDRNAIHALACTQDPEYAPKLKAGDTQRLIRWYEIYLQTGRPMSTFFRDITRQQPRYPALNFVLTRERRELYGRINQRVDTMLEQGLIEEIREAINRGYDFRQIPVVGYTELLPCLDGEASLESCIAEVKKNSRRYAKRQLTWFRNRLQMREIDLSTTGIEQGIEMIVTAWQTSRDTST